MLNIVLLIALLAVFHTTLASNGVCQITKKPLMLPAPGDVYKKPVQFYTNVTVPVFAPVVSPLEVYTNTTKATAFAPAQNIKVAAILEEDADAIHVKSMRIAGFIAQSILFLFVYTIVTMDVENFEESEAEVPVFKLYRAREIQTCPLPARQNVMIVRQFVEMESNC
ncbi:uncharacterized protein CELE_C33F10.1 [Caenorhabditis elegans]|uniref:Uncharacterized protein n=1 Tax=Caenorhabditis elegans TaxID=6239 RepID=Q18389_CAEEL|nr:Uncharacterized protein CELE_C33F10.1 [Caenorhabditis elegans]CCD66505.1 Uncharacterized protein CELE_C33F10.1 [Caenorhabditis elegans]|eukprot:NP_494869.1 Uncharacterized protein CELE_C33F10.1 [Caenorhabditis elegans]